MIRLLKSQKNDVLQMVEQAGFTGSDFAWGERDARYYRSTSVDVLRYQRSSDGYFFCFDCRDGKPYAAFSPGGEAKVEEQFPRDWAHQRLCVKAWLYCLKRETEEPDLWAEAVDAVASLDDDFGNEPDAEPMSDADVAHVLKSIQTVRQLVEQSRQHASEERAAILGILRDVATASGRRENDGSRISKAEFQKTVVGQVVSEVVKAALKLATAKWLLAQLATALGWVHVLGPALRHLLGP